MMPSPNSVFAYDLSQKDDSQTNSPVRSPEWEKSAAPPRLKALSIRRKALRQKTPAPKPFVDLPPTLADAVSFAALEANQERPNLQFTISSAEWPRLRTEPAWSSVVRGAMLFLVDLLVIDRPHLETSVKMEDGRADLVLSLVNRTPSEAEFAPEQLARALQALGKLEGNAQLILDFPTVALRLPIPEASARQTTAI